MNLRDVPELAELGKPGLKQPDWREIMIQIVDSIFQEGNGYMRLGCNARIATAVTDVSNLDTTLAAILKKANPVVRRLVAEMEVHSKRRG